MKNEKKSVEEKKEIERYIAGLDDDALARWMTLIYAQQLIARFCGYDENCIAEKNSKIDEYMRARVPDMKRYIQLKEKGDKLPTIDEFFVVSGTEEGWLNAGEI